MSKIRTPKSYSSSKSSNNKENIDNDPYLEKHFRGHSNTVTGLDFSPVGDQLLSCSDDNSLIIWCIRQSVRCYKFIGHTDSILCARYAPDGNLIATGSKDRTVRLWTPRVKGSCNEFKAHTSSVRSLDFSPDGTKVSFNLCKFNKISLVLWLGPILYWKQIYFKIFSACNVF